MADATRAADTSATDDGRHGADAAPPPVAAAPAAPPPEPNLSKIAGALKAMQEQVRFADAKASFIAAPNVLLISYTATHTDRLLAVPVGGRHAIFWVAAGLLVAYGVSAVASLADVVVTVMPRPVTLVPGGRTSAT